ncbi:uncharacterized protein LOC143021657 [Oratosquilla oratoria]|uniref:uncharacterized protein LOC143021657 n=1 Tax=Oratosquilla oratoria TaxID=337810 RepID=UPI003F76CBE4
MSWPESAPGTIVEIITLSPGWIVILHLGFVGASCVLVKSADGEFCKLGYRHDVVTLRLAKCLAKPLSSQLGTISDAHLRNSSDLIQRLQHLNFKGKKLASYDVKSHYINVNTEGALKAVKREINNINDDEFPVNKRYYLKLVSLCVNFGALAFEHQEFKQIRGLAMGSSLSAVIASLFMECLEADHFKRIIGRGSS